MNPAAPGTQPDQGFAPSPCHCATLRKATRRVTQAYDAVLSPTGLKVTQYSILAEIRRRSRRPPTMGELAEAMVMDRSTLGHNLRPLERERLVELVASEGDRRIRRVQLTAEGRSRFLRAGVHWKAAQSRFEAAVGAVPAAALRTALLALAGMDFTATTGESSEFPEGPLHEI